MKLQYDELLSSFAFKINLRCYSAGVEAVYLKRDPAGPQGRSKGFAYVTFGTAGEAAAAVAAMDGVGPDR